MARRPGGCAGFSACCSSRPICTGLPAPTGIHNNLMLLMSVHGNNWNGHEGLSSAASNKFHTSLVSLAVCCSQQRMGHHRRPQDTVQRLRREARTPDAYAHRRAQASPARRGSAAQDSCVPGQTELWLPHIRQQCCCQAPRQVPRHQAAPAQGGIASPSIS